MAKKPAAAPRADTLLVELLTEELPPHALDAMARAFRDHLTNDLESAGLRAAGSTARCFATPRRLAVAITGVLAAAPDVREKLQGPSVKAPPEAAAGFARKHGLTVDQLAQADSTRGPVYVVERTVPGARLADVLARLVEAALARLPIPKMMRWGDGEAQFVRPAHALTLLHGAKVVPGTVLGLAAGRRTRGHRFLAKGWITLRDAEAYEAQLRDEGRVIAGFQARREEIDRLLVAAARAQRAALGEYAALLDEVTALVEHPSVYVGAFDKAFLDIPQECLALTMRQNQKYFPLYDARGALLARFLIVSNMAVADPRHIIGGNERVVRPRLQDARFFYDQDRRSRLEERVPQLARVVFHHKLGSQLDRVQRMKILAGIVARALGADDKLAERAAELSKADLLTGMVGEFPELQGVMGRYYAEHDGEPAEVARAIEAHYRPRFAGDALPADLIGCAVALADKLYLLAGLFGIGQQPTGDKDPHGLRRAALGVIRILVERALPVSLHDLVNAAYRALPKDIGQAHTDVEMFVLERLRGYLAERGYATTEVDAVLSRAFVRLDQVPRQLDAVRAFAGLPEAPSLAAANKRIANILKQAEGIPAEYDAALFAQAEERALAEAFAALLPGFESAYKDGDYTGALKALAVLKAPVDAFFDKVLVMDKDEGVRRNRIGFLGKLHATMNRIADLSRLAA
ncbi:MAG: glycine--tRNA ligase subunit beta [Betaproteobacteria bacterium]|nr:glycine--tRNA ligase subunit beta [Betaproteobacteria bacterium]MDH5221411.1 glycine--tRNA ligase subunit beta [Betaproteobacteria bacterium]MDH5351710.1 glycine--tRNA ligase subunit beta [Betaproteobacteria bacterium]